MNGERGQRNWHLQFGIKALLALTLIVAVCATIWSPRTALPITEIECIQRWSDIPNLAPTVIFVDASFNGHTNMHRRFFESFCHWFREAYGRNTVRVMTDAGHGEIWDILQQTWSDRNVTTGAYKTWGGAGQVVWVEYGIVVDIAPLWDFNDVESMKQRTRKNFP